MAHGSAPHPACAVMRGLAHMTPSMRPWGYGNGAMPPTANGMTATGAKTESQAESGCEGENGCPRARWHRSGDRIDQHRLAASSRGRDRRTYPPPGRLAKVRGHRLHIMCAGEGTPPVVIIPAMGGL